MTQVFLLGTFHFSHSDIDFFTDDAQRQLWELNERLVKFQPAAIAIEAPPHAQGDVDASFERFFLDDLADYDKMRTGTLGTIRMFGGTHPIPYKNESVQVCYRLGKTVGAEKIYAVDDDTPLNDFPEAMPERIKRAYDDHRRKMHEGERTTILDMLRHCNADAWSYHNQQLYLTLNAVGAGGSYAGADFFGRWYMRNLKTFANMQKLAENHERIFFLYGCGHLYILRELINLCEDMELVDYREYL